MNEKTQALLAMKDIIDRITLVAKDGGRESGLTSGDRAQIMAATQVVAKAIDEGDANAKLLAELKDELAKVRAEFDQVKAGIAAQS
jgi:hypothetical protein